MTKECENDKGASGNDKGMRECSIGQVGMTALFVILVFFNRLLKIAGYVASLRAL